MSDFRVIRADKKHTCDVCNKKIAYGFQVILQCGMGKHYAHLECLNDKAKDVLAEEK